MLANRPPWPDAAIAVVNVIITVINTFGHANNKMLSYPGFKLLSVSEVKDFLIFVLDTCGPYDNAWGVVGRAVQQSAQLPVCSMVRYTYPSPFLYSITEPLFGWLYVGSANPNADIFSYRSDSNCEASDDAAPLSAVCAGISAGYILLEIVLPDFIIILFLTAVARGLRFILWGLVEIGYEGIAYAVGFVERIISLLGV